MATIEEVKQMRINARLQKASEDSVDQKGADALMNAASLKHFGRHREKLCAIRLGSMKTTKNMTDGGCEAILNGKEPQEWLDRIPAPDQIVKLLKRREIQAAALVNAIQRSDDFRGGKRFGEEHPLTWNALLKETAR